MRNDSTIDRLGAVKAEIANLVSLEKILAAAVKNELLESGVASLEGELFRATLSVSERVAVNAKAVQARYPKSTFPELYSSSLVESLRVTARTGEELLQEAA